jgi:hypothetical protein
VLAQLAANRGTVSSALGKALAAEVLAGDGAGILAECIDLASYEPSLPTEKNIRAGAAKVVELVAEKRPEWVAARLRDLLPALSVPEPQTRWAIIRAMGFCAALNPAVAREAVPFAERYLRDKEGLCIASSADLFLGDLSAVSVEDARTVFPVLERSMANLVPNEEDWLLEALASAYGNLGALEREHVRAFAEGQLEAPRKSTRARASRLLGLPES